MGRLLRIQRHQLVIDQFDLRHAIESQADLERLATSIAKYGQAQLRVAVPLRADEFEMVVGCRQARAVRVRKAVRKA